MNFFDIGGLSKRAICLIFIIKIFFGISLWAVYTFYYTDRSTADIYKYFDDSKVMFDALFDKPLDYFRMLFGIGNNQPHFDVYHSKMNNWYRHFDSSLYNDSHTIIRFNALMRLFSFGYFNVHTVFINFLSLIGLTALYKTFYPILKEKNKLLIFSIFFFPSVLFWGSGVLKEGIIIFALGILIYFSTDLLTKISFRSGFFILFSIFLLALTKFYILVAVIPGLVAYQWISKTGQKKIFFKYIVVFSVMAIGGLNMNRIFPRYNPLEIMSIKQKDFINVANGGVVLTNDSIIIKIENNNRDALVKQNEGKYKLKAGSSYEYWGINNLEDTLRISKSKDTSSYTLLFDIPEAKSKIAIGKLEPNFLSFILNAPRAFFTTLFRPYVWEAKSLFMFLPAIENVFIISLTLFSFFYAKSLNTLNMNLILFCFSFVVFLFVIIGVTTPVLGAITRYRMPALPFLLIALLEIIDTGKLKKKSLFPFLWRE